MLADEEEGTWNLGQHVEGCSWWYLSKQSLTSGVSSASCPPLTTGQCIVDRNPPCRWSCSGSQLWGHLSHLDHTDLRLGAPPEAQAWRAAEGLPEDLTSSGRQVELAGAKPSFGA